MKNMATTFPTQTVAPDADYPYGGAQNVATPGDGIGTPWERGFVNDHFGLYAALVDAAGITPSNNSETALVSQLFDAMRIAVSVYKNVKAFGAIGDGVAVDTVAIQAALDSIATDGGGIFFPPGTYLTGTLTVAGNVTIMGIGGDLILEDGTDAPLLTVIAGAENVRILNIKMDGNAANNLGTAATDGLIFLASSGASPIKDVWIKDCIIINSREAAIAIGDDAERIYIVDNYIEGLPLAGGSSVGSGILVSPIASGFTTRVVIQGNEIHNFVNHVIRGGIVKDIQIIGNKIKGALGASQDAIQLTDEDNDGILVANNIVQRIGVHGVNLGGDGIAVTGNLIEAFDDTGIHISATGSANAPSLRCVITGNSIFDPAANASGILAQNCEGVVISGNLVEGDSATGTGIEVINSGAIDTADFFSVVSNTIRNFLISLKITGGSGFKGGTVSANTIRGPGSTGTGLSITNTLQSVFSNNQVIAHAIGLIESTVSDFNNCSINVLRGNTTPISVSGAGTISVSNVV